MELLELYGCYILLKIGDFQIYDILFNYRKKFYIEDIFSDILKWYFNVYFLEFEFFWNFYVSFIGLLDKDVDFRSIGQDIYKCFLEFGYDRLDKIVK